MIKKTKVILIIFIILLGIMSTKAIGIEEDYKSKMYIESGEIITLENNKIWGWMMSDDSNSEIRVLLNDKKQDVEIKRTVRPDVLRLIKGYGTEEQNPNPGYEFTLNTENIKDGDYNLKIQSISSNGKVLEEKIQKITINKYIAKAYIDSPVNGTSVAGKINLKGWIMTNDEKSKIKTYIDGKEINSISNIREDRQDVLKAIKGYGTEEQNPQPGFYSIFSQKGIENGRHTIEIRVFSRENKLMETKREVFYLEKSKARIYIEKPITNGTQINSENKIWGWTMSNDPKSTIKVLLNNQEQNVEIKRTQRQDVVNAVKNYGAQNPTPGFEFNLNVENIKDGKYTLKIQTLSDEGEILAENTREIEIKKYIAKAYIDFPANKASIAGNIKINGWVMTNDEKSTIKTYIDGKEVEEISSIREDRPDVLKSIKGYGTKEQNPKPGFSKEISHKGITSGEHTITIKVFSRENKLMETKTETFYLDKARARMNIENPVENGQIFSNTDNKIWGWIMTNDSNSRIKATLNGKEENIEIVRTTRPDVTRIIKGYGTKEQNPTPGIKYTIDIRKIKTGKHKITLKIFSKEGEEIERKDQTFFINRVKMYIESPTTTEIKENTINISGWVMTDLEDKKVIIKFDNNIIENIKFEERPDVIKLITGFGGIENNPKPGFYATIDISKCKGLNHTITIQICSSKNETIKEEKINIKLKKEIITETLKYGYSGAYVHGENGGTELQCYRWGNGPNVFFAVSCMHGWEDSWRADGEVTVNAAYELYNRLISESDTELANKWTIYIIPEVNPDGRRLGYTNSGPGRTTLYSKTGRGIDLNRCWQIGNSYTIYNTNRNYNGTEGFQAYEAEYLREFLLSHKATTGQNVLVDLHGWEDQLIGDEQICRYYKQQYPSCRTSGYGRYGTQYLITWARQYLSAKVALVEMPKANNYAEVNSKQLTTRYVNGTLQMLREFTTETRARGVYKSPKQIKNLNYEVAFAGMYKKSKPEYEEIDEIIANNYPTENGIWIEVGSRQQTLEYLNSNLNYEYKINEQGYLEIEKEENPTDKDVKIKQAINGEKQYILSISSLNYMIDQVNGKIVDNPYEEFDKYQTYEYIQKENKKIIFITENKNKILDNNEIFESILELL